MLLLLPYSRCHILSCLARLRGPRTDCLALATTNLILAALNGCEGVLIYLSVHTCALRSPADWHVEEWCRGGQCEDKALRVTCKL